MSMGRTHCPCASIARTPIWAATRPAGVWPAPSISGRRPICATPIAAWPRARSSSAACSQARRSPFSAMPCAACRTSPRISRWMDNATGIRPSRQSPAWPRIVLLKWMKRSCWKRSSSDSKLSKANRAEFARVHVCPTGGGDIADDDTSARLIILKPHLTHALRDQQSQARHAASEMLDLRGNTRRGYRNTLVFLAADRNRLEDLKQGVRQYLAWESIHQQSETLNLDAFGRNQARTKRDEAGKSIEARLPETYIWLLVPDQPDPRQPDELQELRLPPQPQSSLTANASRRLKTEEMLITQYAGTLLRREMDRIPLWRGNHVGVKELADFFARYVYLPRLKNTEVLLAAVRDGVQSMWWERETFAYADSWDAERKRYLGLKAGQQAQVTLNANSVLVKPEVAAAQLATEAATVSPTPAVATMTYTETPTIPGSAVSERGGASTIEPAAAVPIPASPHASGQASTPAVQEPQFHRFYSSVKINARMMAGDAGKIMEEVVKHLTTLYGANVQVTLEIQADIPGGVPEGTVRTVTENCRTLRFEGFGFEEE